jgi:hypothetical protein
VRTAVAGTTTSGESAASKVKNDAPPSARSPGHTFSILGDPKGRGGRLDAPQHNGVLVLQVERESRDLHQLLPVPGAPSGADAPGRPSITAYMALYMIAVTTGRIKAMPLDLIHEDYVASC